MKVIKKYAIPYADLTSNATNAETEWTAGTYSLNDIRWYQKSVYKVVVSSTSATPGTSTDWELQEATNVWKFSDNIVGTQTTRADTIEMTIGNPTTLVNGIAFFGLLGDTVNVTVTDITDGEVYNSTVNLNESPDLESDWYSWFFSEFNFREDVIFDDLPSYFGTGVDIDITIDNTGETAKVGEIVLGTIADLGYTAYPVQTSIIDFSRKTTDDNGNFIIEERPFVKRASFAVQVEQSAMTYVQRALADLRNSPTVFIGDSALETTIVYGFYKNFSLSYENPPLALLSIEVEGLV